MCGITGIWVDAYPERALSALSESLGALVHRGPDDRGIAKIRALDGSTVLFGLQRLAILDLSPAGHQPMTDPETGNWITYNGEVYNFRELRLELEQRGCRFRSTSDTEVILQSYKVWGKDCIQHWRGMFAAAFWDELQQELFLVRDRFGIKPLYYIQGEPGCSKKIPFRFAFASEIRSLLAYEIVSPSLNPAAIDTYLMFGAVQDPLSIVKQISSLPPGHCLTISRGQIVEREYWDVLDTGARTSGENETSIGALLHDAVRIHLSSDVPLGVFLSGGIDSSAVAMLAQHGSQEKISTFTIGFEEKEFDENVQAEKTAAQLGLRHNTILLTESEMVASTDSVVEALDQPSIDGVNTFHISSAVKQAGVTVALSGLGGDEVFCGYEHFRTLPRVERAERWWGELPRSVRSATASIIPRNGGDRNAKLRALVLRDYGFPHPYFLSRTLFLPTQIASLLQPDTVEQIDYAHWAKRFETTLKRAKGQDAINLLSYLELKTYLPNTLLRDADVMSMAHSLEIRVPFLDHLLVERVMKVDGRNKVKSGIGKPLLVQSLPRELPQELICGPKRGFVLPYEKWLRGKLRQRVESTFHSPPWELEPFINRESAIRVWEAFLDRRCSWTRPWSLFVLYEVGKSLLRSSSNQRSQNGASAEITLGNRLGQEGPTVIA